MEQTLHFMGIDWGTDDGKNLLGGKSMTMINKHELGLIKTPLTNSGQGTGTGTLPNAL